MESRWQTRRAAPLEGDLGERHPGTEHGEAPNPYESELQSPAERHAWERAEQDPQAVSQHDPWRESHRRVPLPAGGRVYRGGPQMTGWDHTGGGTFGRTPSAPNLGVGPYSHGPTHAGTEPGAGPHAGKGPRNWKRSDERILEDVCERLQAHPGVDASECEVRVEDGVVALEGTVEDRRAKRLAEDCCESVTGVHDVDNRLRIPRPESERGEGQRL